MPKKPVRKPAYSLHKSTGQGRVRIKGKDHYLGEYGSPESRERYDELIAEWLLAQGDVSRVTLTVADLAILYVEHADAYYRKNGQPTSEATNIRIALRPLVRLYQSERARSFGPAKLKAVREEMIKAGCVRTSINRQIGRIKRMFRWAVENDHIPPEVYTGLAAVAGLQKGRSEAIEAAPVKPVPEAYVKAVEPHVSRQVWAMV